MILLQVSIMATCEQVITLDIGQNLLTSRGTNVWIMEILKAVDQVGKAVL